MEGGEQGYVLIVGLGNPGRRHAGNRHNVGFQCLDRLAKTHGLVFDQKLHRADLALGRIAGRRVLLAKPRTFVNDSGLAVGAVARFYKVEPQDVLVIYDDLDLPQGTIRVRPKGGSGGHNGIRSVIDHVGTPDFGRIRVGIGRPPGQMEPKSYVLQDWSPAEQEVMDEVYDRVVATAGTVIEYGIAVAMNRFNARPHAEEVPLNP